MTLMRKLSGGKPKTLMPRGATDTQMHLYLDGFPAQPGGPPVPEGTPGIDDYRKVADWLGIDRVVVTAGNAHQLDNSCLPCGHRSDTMRSSKNQFQRRS